MTSPVPGWQTEELQDEWPDLESDEGHDDYDLSCGTRSVSLTIPLCSEIHTTPSDVITSADKLETKGTFIVRKDVFDVPLLPKTPGRNKNLIKDFFTPLPLERMFEPPSPPSPSSTAEVDVGKVGLSPGLNQACGLKTRPGKEADLPITDNIHDRKTTLGCQFTFMVPRVAPARPNGASLGVLPQAQSTPTPPTPVTTAPATDPRLRLFQFQYDTYTREHLSALVDSIAVNTPSGTGTGTTPTPTSLIHKPSRVPILPDSGPHLRTAKRVKLSPLSDFREENTNDNVSVNRPIPKDYIGASMSLMQQIKLAKDYSTISTVASAPNITMQGEKSVVEHLKTSNSTDGTYSSSSYRQKAAVLMEQIKSDVKSHKRTFSGDSEPPDVTTISVHADKHGNSSQESTRSHRRKLSRQGVSRSSFVRQCKGPKIDTITDLSLGCEASNHYFDSSDNYNFVQSVTPISQPRKLHTTRANDFKTTPSPH